MISEQLEKILAQVRDLTADERELLILLAQEMQDANADPGVDAAWIVEVNRRLDASDRGEAKTVAWEDVRARLSPKKPPT